MIEITTNQAAFDDQLQQLQRRLGNLRPVFQDVGAVLENKVRDRRESMTDPNGLRWAEWSEWTRATYPQDGRGKLLDRTGAMWDKPGGPIWQLTADGVRVGFDKGYATWHELGTKNMPRRGLLFADPDSGTLGADDEAAVLDVLEKWLSGALG